MKYSFLLIILAIVAYAGAQTCYSDYTTCGTCTADPKCGWCGPIQKCYDGTRSGPTNGNTCYGTAWFYGNSSCPTCGNMPDCISCLEWGADCAWCSSQGKCREWGSTLGCGAVDYCPCGQYSSCSLCYQDPQCTWCGGQNQTCIPVAEQASCPMPQHTCPCSDNKDCGSCLGDAGCTWCEVTGGAQCQSNTLACSNVAMNCNTFCHNMATTCDTCNDLPGCGWCDATTSCVDASSSACQLISHTCPNCGSHRYCDPCQDEGCIWCANGECRQPGDTIGCMIQHTCYSYCQGYPDCGTCNQTPGCGWCDQTGSCVDADKSTCILAHSCSDAGRSCGFDGGAFVGGMFLGIGLCAIGVGGYLFYRWKVGKKPGYSELH